MTQHSSAAFGVGDVACSDGSRGVPTSASLPHQGTSLAGCSEAAQQCPKARGLSTATGSDSLKGQGMLPLQGRLHFKCFPSLPKLV